MKHLLLALCAFGIVSISLGQGKKADDVAKFDNETIDLGKIKQGTPTTAVFKVKNIGSDALLIEQANPTCGCTISNYTKEPIAVGKYGEINATYNAAAAGTFEKHLTVKFAGTDEVKSITIKGQVLSADDFAAMNNGTAPPAPQVTPVSGPEIKEAKDPAAPAKKTAAPAPKKSATTTAPATKKPAATAAPAPANKTGN